MGTRMPTRAATRSPSITKDRRLSSTSRDPAQGPWRGLCAMPGDCLSSGLCIRQTAGSVSVRG
jgi:hypothetical protein